MTNNNMGPAFEFMLIGMLVLLVITSISVNSNSVLITRAIKELEESFSGNRIPDIQNPTEDDMLFTESGASEDLSW